MTIYSLYIFDRHCQCIYYHDWHRSKRPKPAAKDAILPAVSRAVTQQPLVSEGAVGQISTFSSPRNTLISNSGTVVAINEEPEFSSISAASAAAQSQVNAQSGALPFDEEAKLVYGVVLSLRTMVKKLAKRDENFTSYRTSTYKMHLYETPTLYKFILLSDPKIEGSTVRFMLRQIYAGPFLDYVVRNPLVPMDSRDRGIDNEYFRATLDRLVRGQAFFQ